MARVVHIVGTGTIGEPLIGLFCNLREAFGLDDVTFHKRTALTHERAKVNSLLGRGARLVVDDDQVEAFERLGHKVSYRAREGLARATVVIDCTPEANDNRTLYAETEGPRVFMAEASEFGFGQPYARGINDEALDLEDRFVQIVSCNTHNICVLAKTLATRSSGPSKGELGLVRGQFVCMRRASDISQAEGFIPAPEVTPHDDARFGTRHARDAWSVFQTLGLDVDLFSSVVEIPTQYMHTMHFALELEDPATREQLLAALAENPRVALTEKLSATLVFSFGRDHGIHGRLLTESVIPTETLHVSENGRRVAGYCFIPQDGNSLLSTIACTLWYLNGEDPWTRLEAIRQWMFQEV